MGSIWERFKRSVTSNVNSMISKSEDPEKMLNQLIIEMNSQLIEAKKSVASAISDERRMFREVSLQEKKANEWEERAVLALREADNNPSERERYENLAREALKAKREILAISEEQKKQYEIQHENVEKLKSSLKELQGKLDEAQRKKNLLIARAKRAETQKKIQEQISGFSSTSAFEAFNELEKKVDSLEIEAETMTSIEEDTRAISQDASLESEFSKLEKNKFDIELESSLDDLRKKVSSLPKSTSNSSQGNSSNSYKADPELDAMMIELKNKNKEN